ncbi:dihydrodipicolinate synthase family protein [Pseudomonas sp. S35]|uniref:dihydrodipicolinate synthase family protein n=1 Tax=Pseudomonas sp. S35 TaxID=1573719 RepID=UPI00132F477D|nr:dihydrodipicolinate synthase family protein [Pseudomonas sp. S35]QHF44069.1 dihydrodipicolinate synthase family protein [Pseudomonas sp. S35]
MTHQVLVPLVTPISAEGDVCRASVARLVRSLRHGVDGFIVCLTSGEGWLLNERQWRAMLEATLEQAGSLPVVAGIERATTDAVLAYAQQAQQSGVAGIMLTSPFGSLVDQAAILTHYREVHDGIDLDIHIYNESSLSGNETSVDTLLAIAALPRVVGIKDSAEEPRSPQQINALQAHGLKYYLGWERHLGAGLPADGCVVSLANLEPALCRIAMMSEGDALRAEVARLTGIYSLLSEDWYAHIKQELFDRGVIASPHAVGH